MEKLIPLASYRQAITINELLKKVVIGLMILSTVLAIVIGSLFPLKQVKYKLYEFSSSGQSFKRIDDANGLVKRSPALIQFLMRQYVSNRETIDRKTQMERTRLVHQESNVATYNKFKERYKKVDQQLGDTGTRLITIELDNPFNNDWDKQIHEVEFSTKDTSEQGQVIVRKWKAVIGYRFNKQKLRIDDLIQNPLGVEITDYETIARLIN
ncbi:MAG: Inner membrane protein forms channel for type IV secretion of T-DNA complex, VirB8 [Candidatus Ruthia sp. Asou_11_S2]|nr:Inner membrane protein forms channel for type IV secretion of T-DNA complex, VirB8 [Candidatus Ruthia sp. Asou_11_S2]